MSPLKFGFLSLTIILFFKTANAALGARCGADGDCDQGGNNEICSTDGTAVCICDSGNNYKPGPVTTTSCFLTVNLGQTCIADAHDECKLGDGGTGAICSAGTSQCDCDQANKYVKDAGTCKKDCGNPTNSPGYTVTVGQGAAATLEGATATVACATGYTGLPASVTCQASGTWTTPSGCSLSNAGSIDCGNPTNSTGYIVTVGQGAAATLGGATATVTCATGYTGTPPNVTCQDSGTWTTPSGCSLSNAGSIGAGMIGQQFGLIVLIGVLFRAFM